MNNGDYYTIFDDLEQVCDFIGEPYRFESLEEAETFIQDVLEDDPWNYQIVRQHRN